MSKTSRRNAIVVSVLIVALCAAVIGGATFALYSAGDTHNITVTSGDIQLSSTVKLTSAWTTAQSGEKTDANVTDNKTAALSTGGKVSVDEGGNITFDRIALGDGATFEVTLSMAYTINMKYSLVLSAQGASEFLRNNLEITVGEDSANSLANGDIYIIPWTAAEALGDNEASKEGSATATFTISLPWSAEDSAVSGSESLTLSLTASGVQSNALTGITTESGGNFSTLKEAAQSASATDTIILGNDMTNAVWTEEVSAAAGNKELTVVGAGANTTALSVNAALPANVTLSNLAVTDDLVLQSGASLEDVTVNGSVTVNGASSRAAVMSLANESQVSGGKSVFNGVTFKEGLVLNNADVTITNSTIDDYNGTAVYVTGGSLTLGNGNYFSAVGPNSVIAAFGATVTITGGEYVAAADMATNTGLNYQDGKALALYSNSSATISGGKLDSRANNQTVQLGSFDEDNPETNTSASLTFTGGEITSYNVGSAVLSASESNIIANGSNITSTGSSGTIKADKSTVKLTGCTISTTSKAGSAAGSAIHATNNSSVTLDGTSITSNDTFGIAVMSGSNVALNNNSSITAKNSYGIVVFANSDATVNNSTVKADLPIYTYGENANVVVDGSNSVISSNALTSTAVQSGYYDKSKKIPYTGSFTLKNGKVEGGIFASGSGVVNIEGGSVHAAYLAISNNNTTTDGTSINISGGSVTVDDDVAIYLPGDGAFTMTGGSVTGGTAIDVRMGTVKITGGTLTSTYNQNAPLDELTDVNGGTMMDGSVIMVNSGLYLNTAGELAGITVTIGKDVIMNKTAEEADYVRHYDWNQNEQPASITVENEAYTIAHYALQDGTVSKQEA